MNMKLKGDKNRELEAFAEKESRLLAALFLHLFTLLPDTLNISSYFSPHLLLLV